jgi:DNA-binding CsgD family transcriptional regulator
MSKYKQDIIRLRKQGKSYREIENELGCSKGTIAYHCKQEGLEDIGKKKKKISDEKKEAIRETYKEETAQRTAEIHDVSESTVKKYGSPKRKKNEYEQHSGGQNTKQKGDITEMKIATRLVELGYTVLEPFGDNDAYDLVFENEDDDFQRVQCKTGRDTGQGSLEFSVSTQSSHKKSKRRTYHGKIDFFGVYYPQNRKTYLVPFEEVSDINHEARLRLSTPKNNQKKKIRLAESFEM